MLCPDTSDYFDFQAGLLPPEKAASLEEHLSGCPACSAALAELLASQVKAPSVAGPESDPTFLRAESPAAGEARLPELGALVAGKYRLEQLLGRGGMGAVYQAEHVAIGRKVAVKLLLPRLAADQQALTRFRMEARAAAAIGHPGVADVLDAGDSPEHGAFLVMELLQGETLAARIGREGPLPFGEAGRIVELILEALCAVHERGIVHRDLKPANVFLVASSRAVKLLDFGISKFDRQGAPSHTRSDLVMGTVAYMSPEQAKGAKDAGPAADLFSVGAILYEALAGAPAFPGQSYNEIISKVLTETPRPLELIRADVPASLAALIGRLLAKTPEARPPGAAEALQELREALDDSTPVAAARRRKRMVIGAATILAIAGIVGGTGALLAQRPAPVQSARPPEVPPAVQERAVASAEAVAPAPAASSSIRVELFAEPAAARFFLGSEPLACNDSCSLARPAGTRLELSVRAPGYAEQKIPIVFAKPHELRVILVKAAAKPPSPKAAPSKPSPTPIPAPAPALKIEKDNPYQ